MTHQPCHAQFRRIWSLWDIMNYFHAPEVCSAAVHLETLKTTLAMVQLTEAAVDHTLLKIGGEGGTRFETPDGVVEQAKAVIGFAATACNKAHFEDAKSKLSEIQININAQGKVPGQGHDISALKIELRHASDALTRELVSRRFLYVPNERTTFLDNPQLLGASVASAFPSAVEDIKEAGNCLAADCNTAGVFHLMRAVEWGLRALCVHLGFKNVKAKIRKSGKVVYTPIEYSEWEKILDGLQDKVDAKLTRLKRGTQKQKLQEFYYPALQDIRGLRDAWRNHVMHARGTYTGPDADAVLDHVRRLMVKLATTIAEV